MTHAQATDISVRALPKYAPMRRPTSIVRQAKTATSAAVAPANNALSSDNFSRQVRRMAFLGASGSVAS